MGPDGFPIVPAIHGSAPDRSDGNESGDSEIRCNEVLRSETNHRMCKANGRGSKLTTEVKEFGRRRCE